MFKASNKGIGSLIVIFKNEIGGLDLTIPVFETVNCSNTISLSRHEQVCLMRLRFERYFSHHQDTSTILAR